MKKLILITITVLLTINVWAQWSTPDTEGKIYYNGGNVGIGTSNPNNILDIVGNSIEMGSTEADISAKYSRFLSKHYSNTELPMIVFMGASSEGINDARIGGGTIYGNAATKITFWTGTNSTTNKGTQRMIINNNGNVGVGVLGPDARLDVRTEDSHLARFMYLGDDTRPRVDIWGSTNKINIRTTYGTGGADLSFGTYHVNDALIIKENGRIGIGTTDPDYKLTVDGTINCEEVKVEIIDGADKVFEEDYNLKKLDELEEFVKTNKHLPEIATEKEMQANGVDMGEFQIQLLQKVEELTLYVIDLKKENKAQQEVNNELKDEIEQLKKMIK